MVKTGLRWNLAYRCGMLWFSQFKRIFQCYFNQYALSTYPLSLFFLISSFLNKCINISENLNATYPQLVGCEREQMKSWHLLLWQCQNSTSVLEPLSMSVWSAALRDTLQGGRFNVISANMLISATSFQKCSSACAPLFKILVMPSFFPQLMDLRTKLWLCLLVWCRQWIVPCLCSDHFNLIVIRYFSTHRYQNNVPEEGMLQFMTIGLHSLRRMFHIFKIMVWLLPGLWVWFFSKKILCIWINHEKNEQERN